MERLRKFTRFWKRHRKTTNTATTLSQDGLTGFESLKKRSSTSISTEVSAKVSSVERKKSKQNNLASPSRRWLTEKEKTYIRTTWQKINENEAHGKALMAQAWLMAGERSPVWIWGLIGVDETMQNEATKHPHFSALITGVHCFFDGAIVKMNLDEETIKDTAERLGKRHRLYYADGGQSAYWESFKTSLIDIIHKELTTTKPAHATIRRKYSLGSFLNMSNACTTDEVVPMAWPKFITLLTNAIRDGYVDREVNRRLTSRPLSTNEKDSCKGQQHNVAQLSPEICRKERVDPLNYGSVMCAGSFSV